MAERGHPASEVEARQGGSVHSLYAWAKRYGVHKEEGKAVDSQAEELAAVLDLFSRQVVGWSMSSRIDASWR